MSEAPQADRVPSFRRGTKFRFDTVRDAWIVLAPERLFVPDEQAVS
jgi:pyrroloquinoline quinone biosynthesis protein D